MNCEVLTESKSGAVSWEYSLFNPAWKVDTKTKLNKYSENLVAAHSQEGGGIPLLEARTPVFRVLRTLMQDRLPPCPGHLMGFL